MSAQANAKARAFLAAFKITGSVVLAASAAGVEKTIHYRWLRNESYAKAFAQAEAEFADVLEAAAIARAKDGMLEPVFYQGAPCGAIRKYSDGLMVHLLKRFKPEKYAARVNAELSGPGGGSIPITTPGLAALTDDELAALIATAQKLASAQAHAGGTEETGAPED
jgi:hypothetical protein